MKIRALLASFAICCGIFSATQVRAQSSNTSRVAVINMQSAVLDSIDGRKAAQTLKTKYDAKAAELEKMKKEIEELTAELTQQEKSLSDEAKGQKAKLIEIKTKDLNRSGEDANNEFQQLQNEAINNIGTKIVKVLQAYAADQNITLVIDSSSSQSGVLYYNPRADITNEIIRRFDAQSTASTAAPAPTTKK
jgi:outer membrane protein